MYQVRDGSTSTFSVEVELSANDLTTLEKFASSEYGTVQDAHAVLSHMVKMVVISDGYIPATWNQAIAEAIGGSAHLILMVSVVCFNSL